MIGICTDSSAQLPPELAQRYGVEVVPITVIVDGHEYLEGVDLDADGFNTMCAAGHRPVLSISQPSPGQFALAYEASAARGSVQILSIHASSTLNAAVLAAHNALVPVRLIDSGATSFGVSCCVWATAEAIAHGASFDEAAAVAEGLSPDIGNVFIGDMSNSRDIKVLTTREGEDEVIERVQSMVDAVNAMARYVVGWGPRVNVGVGIRDLSNAPIGDALAQAAGEAANVVEVVRFRFGPSAADGMAPRAVGCFVFRV